MNSTEKLPHKECTRIYRDCNKRTRKCATVVNHIVIHCYNKVCSHLCATLTLPMKSCGGAGYGQCS